jgi:DnaJ like chaperone protein
MRWIGKLLGALAGYLIAGVWGILPGLLIGHLFDRGLRGGAAGVDRARVHAVFFRASFRVMGRVAKADGRVSEAEIAAAERVMAQMRLSPEQRREAVEHFRFGKSDEFDLDAELDEFLEVCRRRLNLLRIFLEIQLQAALADGELDAGERDVLRRISRRLGLSDADFDRLVAALESARQRARGGGRQGPDELAQAYRELGISPEASDAEAKRAYRRLMSEHHPDKLVARGLPEEMAEVAKQRTQEIQAAWEVVRRARGIR